MFSEYPYLLPNLVSGLLLLADLVLSLFWLDESLAEAQELPPLKQRVACLFSWLWQFMTSYSPSYLRGRGGSEEDGEEAEAANTPVSLAEACPTLLPDNTEKVSYQEIMVPQIMVLMISYTIFSLSNVTFNSLYPIYMAAPRPAGRELSPKEIGLSLAFAGAVAIVFQAFMFSPMHGRFGSVWCYRSAFFGFAIAFLGMPLVGIRASSTKARIWAELSTALLVKSVSAVGGLTCAMLLITNASPKASTLGMLNGLAQTLGAGGRAVGPFLSGSLFTAGFRMAGGEWLAWGVFGGIAVLGLAFSFALRLKKLENGDGVDDDQETAPLVARGDDDGEMDEI